MGLGFRVRVKVRLGVRLRARPPELSQPAGHGLPRWKATRRAPAPRSRASHLVRVRVGARVSSRVRMRPCLS